MTDINEILEKLNSEDFSERIQAITRLGGIKSERSLDVLIKTLDDDDSHVRKYAAIALGHLGDEKAIRPLIKACSYSDSETRLGIIQGLAEFKTDEVLECLKKLSQDDDLQVRVVLFDKLGTFPAEKIIDFLISEFPRQRGRVKGKIISLLSQFHSNLSTEQLEKIKNLLDPIISTRIGDLSDHSYAGETLEGEFTVSEAAVEMLEQTVYFFTDYHVKRLQGLLNHEEATRLNAERVLDKLNDFQKHE
ncbi:MAG: HEAT repeat domain-containing protein [Candidatus Helarchaeota archaeon]